MSTLSLKTPEHAGSREQARDLVRLLGDDLSGQVVCLDFSAILVSTPSFVDELVKQILEQRQASVLEVIGATDRARDQLCRSADNRDVRNRLRLAAGDD